MARPFDAIPFPDPLGDAEYDLFLVYVKTQCTVPLFAVAYADSPGAAVDDVAKSLGRLSRASDFGSIVLGVLNGGETYRLYDERPTLE